MGAIYSILNKENGKIYVGQSVNPKQRFAKHKSLLRYNKHDNDHLQNSWNKYGEDAFEFNILENSSDEMLNDNESWWIEYFDSTNHNKGFNMTDGGDYEYTHHEESINKLKQYCGENHSQFGTSIIDEQGGLDSVIECAEKGMSIRATAKKFGVAKPTLSGYLKRRGIQWRDISSNDFVYHDTVKIIDDAGGVDFLKSEKLKGKTTHEVCDELGIHKDAVKKYLSKHGLLWSTIAGKLSNRKSHQKDKIEQFGGLEGIKQWIIDGKSKKSYCEHLGISEKPLRLYLNEYGKNWSTLKREVV